MCPNCGGELDTERIDDVIYIYCLNCDYQREDDSEALDWEPEPTDDEINFI